MRPQTAATRTRFKVAEREGFEPPIGLHLCRISSAVHSTTLPPLQAPTMKGRFSRPRSGGVLGEDGGGDKAREAEKIRLPAEADAPEIKGVGPPDAKKTGGPVPLR